jgi:hypothetical protein
LKHFGRVLMGLLILVIGWGMIPPGRVVAHASIAPNTPTGPDRFKKTTVAYTKYEWWLARWENNEVVCQIFIDHEGLPAGDEILKPCGEDIYNEWLASAPCPSGENCDGLYLHFVDSIPAEKDVTIALPNPTVTISLEDCPLRPDRGCSTQPSLLLKGLEPLPNEKIISIEGTVGEQPFHCEGDVCRFTLENTATGGVALTFWAFSSYGDSTVQYVAAMRVAVKQPEGEDNPVWYVDVYSTQWMGLPPASCAEVWDAFPTPGEFPVWLETPSSVDGLASKEPYAYLAGKMISGGFVDASACIDGGLTPDGTANTCGLDTAQEAVNNWQNRFDSIILTVAQNTGIPAHMLKNMFSRESQFWPGSYTGTKDTGFGQLTENGADTTLLWNPVYYSQFCPTVLSDETCKIGYALLPPADQEMLRAALVQSVDATCANCAFGLDLTKADESIGVFAATVTANCRQAGQVVQQMTGKAPGSITSYEDMWKFTLINYNAGPGCLTLAVGAVQTAGLPLNWENLSPKLLPACDGAVNYVNDITH